MELELVKQGQDLVGQDYVEGLEAEMKARRQKMLDLIASTLTPLRDEAVSARVSSGIERIWAYCDMAMNGQDEVSMKGMAAMYEPMTPGGPFIPKDPKRQKWNRSIATINITAPYVLTAAGKAHEVLVPNDRRNWALGPTPKQDADALLDWMLQLPDPNQVETLLSYVQAALQRNVAEIESAQLQIDDWLNEGPRPYTDLTGRLLEDSARTGTGILSGPKNLYTQKGYQPGVEVISCWNLYPAANCGEDIHNGDYIWEVEDQTPRQIRELILRTEEGMAMGEEDSGWLVDQLQAVLEEGPSCYRKSKYFTQGKVFEFWKYQGEVDADFVKSCGCVLPKETGKKVWALVTLCNNRIVRVSRAPLERRFTYQVLPWRRRVGSWTGIGVAEDLEMPQRSLNAQVRVLQDNSALAAIPQIVYWKGLLNPQNGNTELEPGKIWTVNPDTITTELDVSNLKNAIFTIEIPCRLNEIRENILLFLSLAEQATGIAGVVRGLEQPQSVGGGQIQMNAASLNTRRIAHAWDNFIMRPLIQEFVRWIRAFELLPLGETTVSVFGSSVLVDRDLQAQAVQAAVQMAANPLFEHDPALMFDLWLEANRFDPARTKMTPERKQQLQEMLSKPDEKAQATVRSAELRAQALTQQAMLEAQTDQGKAMATLEDSARGRMHERDMAILKYKTDLLSYASQRQIDLQTAQAEIQMLEIPKELLMKAVDRENQKEIATSAPKPTNPARSA